MSSPDPLMFVFDYGLTPIQKAWLAQAAATERAAFFLSAPVRIAVITALTPGIGLTHQYLPVIHGVPVGLGTSGPSAEPRDALATGLAFQDQLRATGASVPLDLDGLGLRGDSADEYPTPDTFDLALSADTLVILSGTLP